MPCAAKPQTFANTLVAWYNQGHRNLAWRATTAPYNLWLAEIMLQQTTVAAVVPYYEKFLSKFPTVQALAAAPLQEVLHLWQGLGYYRRAHLLHRCAQVVVSTHAGQFPTTEAELLKLPGLGPYTAAVVAACAYEEPTTVIDGNVLRVVARVKGLNTPLTPTHKTLRAAAAELCKQAPPRLYANAIMELGATVCTPTSPKCGACPVQHFCTAYAQGNPTAYPVKLAKSKLSERAGIAYVLQDASGNLWLQQRPNTGLLAGLWEVPWAPQALPEFNHLKLTEAGHINHSFTHFKLTLGVRVGQVKNIPTANRWPLASLPPLANLMRKVLAAATIKKA